MTRWILWGIPAILAAACGPTVQEHRVKYASARDENCLMNVVHSSPADFSANSRYEHLGDITLSQTEVQDPYAPQNLEQARARACAMGADAIMVLREKSRRHADEAAIRYAAMRDRKPSGAPRTAPQRSL